MLKKVNPQCADVREQIGGRMKRVNMTQRELSKLTGIPETTLSKRLRDDAGIQGMRLGELWAIQAVLRG